MNIGKLNSYFGEGTVLKGSLKFKGLLRFDGDFEGEVVSDDTFIVGETGKIRANVKAGHLFNFGSITGDVEAAGKISLHAGSSLEGNIKTPALITEEMAYFQGSCYMPAAERKTAAETRAAKHAQYAPSLPEIEKEALAGIGKSAAGSSPLAKTAAILFLLAVAGGVIWFTGGGEWVMDIYQVKASERAMASLRTDSPAPERETGGVETERTPSAGSPQVEGKDAPAEKSDETAAFAAKISKSPQDTEPRLKLAELLLGKRDYKEAVKTLEKAVEDIPGDAGLRTQLARVYYMTGREKDAFEQFKIVVKDNPESLEAMSNRAFQRLEIGALDEAEKGFRDVLSRDPDNHRARLGLATVYSKMDKTDAAMNECKTILEKEPGYAPALNRMAWIYAKKQTNLEKAEELSKKSLAVFDDIPEYIDTLSEINFQMGQYDAAIELIKRAITLVPGDSYYERQLFKFQRARRRS